MQHIRIIAFAIVLLVSANNKAQESEYYDKYDSLICLIQKLMFDESLYDYQKLNALIQESKKINPKNPNGLYHELVLQIMQNPEDLIKGKAIADELIMISEKYNDQDDNDAERTCTLEKKVCLSYAYMLNAYIKLQHKYYNPKEALRLMQKAYSETMTNRNAADVRVAKALSYFQEQGFTPLVIPPNSLEFNEDGEYILYKKSTVKKKGSKIRVWSISLNIENPEEKMTYKEKMEYYKKDCNESFLEVSNTVNFSHDLYEYEIDCSRETLVTLQKLSYNYDGELIDSRKNTMRQPEGVIPGTIGEAILELVCKSSK